MIDPNKGASEDVLRKHKEGSYERMRMQLYEAIEKKMAEFHMTWDDLANKLTWPNGDGNYLSGDDVKIEVGMGPLSEKEINDIAHCFSAEAYIIFRPRQPITLT